MPRTTPLLLVLGLAALLLASPALAKSPPDHAGDPGPPDHAQAPPDRGPPDHARAGGSPQDPDEEPATASTTSSQEPADATEPQEKPALSENEGEDPTQASPSADPAASRADEPEPAAREPDEKSTPSEPGAPEAPSSMVHAGTPTTLRDQPKDAPISLGPGASPSTSEAGSASAPGWSGSLPLVGPALVVGLLGVGLVARARFPSQKTAEASEPEPEAGSEPQESEPDPPKPSPVGLLTLGQRALDRGDVEAAAEWFRTVTLATPERQAAHFCLGLSLAELDRLEEAEGALAEACRLRPGDVEATYAHAQVLLRQGHHRDALRRLERLADEMPGLPARLRGDDTWARLHDHPRWLALAGELEEAVGPSEDGEPPA